MQRFFPRRRRLREGRFVLGFHGCVLDLCMSRGAVGASAATPRRCSPPFSQQDDGASQIASREESRFRGDCAGGGWWCSARRGPCARDEPCSAVQCIGDGHPSALRVQMAMAMAMAMAIAMRCNAIRCDERWVDGGRVAPPASLPFLPSTHALLLFLLFWQALYTRTCTS